MLGGADSKQDRAHSKQLVRQTVAELEEVLRVLRGTGANREGPPEPELRPNVAQLRFDA